ncbi:MAG: hypothetical protein K2N72_01420 [Oscillospiraceae bacterium]|nr:hypothetical protein [Oscillospiraceae bacterium]
MNEFNKTFKGAAGCIVTDRDIVSEAAQRAAQSCGAGRRVRKLRPAVCALLAAAMICGTGVSAVKYGWLNVVFGDSGNVILENPSDYSLEISGLETECRLPDGEISLNDVVCDGEAIYINLRLTGATEEDMQNYADFARIYPQLTTADGAFKSTVQLFSIGITDHGEDFVEMYASISSADGIDIGDKIDFKFYELSEAMYDPDEEYDFRIAFDVAEQPSDMTISLAPDREMTLVSGLFNRTMEINAESIIISPLTYQFTATILSSTGYSFDNIYEAMNQEAAVFVMKDGSRISGMDICDSYGGSLDGNDTYHIYAFFKRVFPVDDLAGIEIGGSYIEVTR